MKKFLVTRFLLIVVGFSFSSFGLANDVQKQADVPQPDLNATLRQQKLAFLKTLARTPDATTDCSFTFSSGSNNNSLEYCVTANGNISEFQMPIGHPLISVQDRAEGYAICDVTNGDPQGNGRVAYSDFAFFGDSANWNPPTVLSRNATSVKIARTTSDGIWTLTQTFTQQTSPAAVKIGMVLKNNTAAAREAFLLRWADVDADGIVQNNFDGTAGAAFGWNSITSGAAAPVGLLLENTGTLNGFGSEGFIQNSFVPPNPCNPGLNIAPSTVLSTDGSVVLLYDIRLTSRGSKSVTLTYKGL